MTCLYIHVKFFYSVPEKCDFLKTVTFDLFLQNGNTFQKWSCRTGTPLYIKAIHAKNTVVNILLAGASGANFSQITGFFFQRQCNCSQRGDKFVYSLNMNFDKLNLNQQGDQMQFISKSQAMKDTH